MPNESTKEIEAKIDAVAGDLAAIRKDLEAVSSLPSLEKKVDSLDTELSAVKKQLDSLGSGLGKLSESKELKAVDKKIDDVGKSIDSISSGVAEIMDSKEMQVMYKKMDDLLVATADIGTEVKELQSTQSDEFSKKADTILDAFKVLDGKIGSLGDDDNAETIGKKIDDLQQYVASLSGLEEKVELMATSLTETKEIVGIIVRQLDDIERKYNAAVEKIEEAAEIFSSMPAASSESGGDVSDAKRSTKKPIAEEPPIIPKGALPSNIEEIMKNLLSMVSSQTEARKMASSLEDARDKLIPMLKEHTPVLHEFGKRARELKSYPPTAMLNENDIAGLNTDIRNWTSKLKEIAKGK